MKTVRSVTDVNYVKMKEFFSFYVERYFPKPESLPPEDGH